MSPVAGVQTAVAFMVRRDDPSQTRFATSPLSPLADGEVVLAYIDFARGNEAVERVYRDALAGRLQPNTGNILSLS